MNAKPGLPALAEFSPDRSAASPINVLVTALDIPIADTSAERQASTNFIANRCALAATQPEFAASLLPPRETVEWVYGRDGALTALDARGDWWSGCSVPHAAAVAMLQKMDVHAPVACFLAPPHASAIEIALEKLAPEQSIVAVIPDESDVRLVLACGRFARDIAGHRLWIAAGADWAGMLESMLTQQFGLAVPAQFLRLPSTDDSLVQKLIQEATAVLSRITNLRSKRVGELSRMLGKPRPSGRRFCVVAPRQFRLWEDEAAVLANLAPADSIQIDTSDPAQSSPLKLATTACEAGAVLAANFARADLPGILPANVPWICWITNDRIPAFAPAGPNDQLLVAATSGRAAAIAAGWPAERARIAGWPSLILPAAKGKRQAAVFADTVPLTTPEDLEDFSSHRVLWETIRQEITNDPFVLDCDPARFLSSRMQRFDVSAGAFPHKRFLNQLIVPVYQQGVVRALLKAGLPVQIFGDGWGEIEEFEHASKGLIRSEAELLGALGNAAVLVDLWPWRTAHPIGRVGRAMLVRRERSLPTFLQRARQILATGTTTPTVQPNALSTALLSTLL